MLCICSGAATRFHWTKNKNYEILLLLACFVMSFHTCIDWISVHTTIEPRWSPMVACHYDGDIDDRMGGCALARDVRAVGPERELYEACKSDVRWMAYSKLRWIHARCAIRKASIRASSPSGPSLTASAIRIALASGLLRKFTRMHSAHLPSTAHRRASAQARRSPRTICICGCGIVP